LDICSHNGYTVTQEANTEVDGVVTFRNIKLSPKNMPCISGCECPEVCIASVFCCKALAGWIS
jgi:hypothetical protein